MSEILFCSFGIPKQRLCNVYQFFVCCSAVESVTAVVHRTVGDGSESGFSLFDRYCKAVLKLARRDISDTRYLSASVLFGFNRADIVVFVNTGECQLVSIGKVKRKSRLRLQRKRRAVELGFRKSAGGNHSRNS